MEIRANASDAANELRVELKYCERCGGLWLRAVGVAEVYCAGCGREMDEMPAVSYENDGAEGVRTQRRLQWILENSGLEGPDDYEDSDLEAGEGVA
jgi:hypothetical protein